MIYALDAATGQTLWSRTGGEPLARIAYDAGRVFSYDKTGSLRALDAATGCTEWIAAQTQRFGSSPPIAHDGVVYTVGDGDGTDGYARRESDGQLVWTASEMPAGGVPAIGDGRIYVSGGCSGAEARDLATGRYVWHRSATPSCTQDDGPTTVFADGLLSVRAHYFTAPHGALLNAADGTELARSDADWAPAVKGSLRLVMAAGVLRAESAAGGPALWTFTGDGKLTGPALIVGDHAYVTSASGRVYALNLAFGYQEWSDDTGTPINPSESFVGLGAGGGLLAVPAGGTLVGYATGDVEGATPPPASDDPAPGPAAPSDVASAFQVNPARDGHVDGDFLDGDLHEAWSHSLGPRISYPLIADGRIFVIEYDSAAEGGWQLRGRSIGSRDDRCGVSRSRSRIEGSADKMALAYSDGRVFVVTPDSVALGFDASDGRQLWRHYLGGESSATPIAVDGTLFVTVEDRYDFAKGSLYALDAGDGSTQWSRVHAVHGSAAPALVGDRVYAASSCGTPAAFDRHTGATVASAPCNNGLLGEQLSVHGQRIYAGGMVHTLDGTPLDVSGPLDWRALEPHSFAGALTLYRNGSRLQAEDVRTGVIAWEFSDRGKWVAPPPLIVGDRVVSIATDGHVNVLDLATGEPRWSGDLGTYAQSAPAAAEGTLVVPAGGRLVAYTRTGANLPAARITDAPGFTAQRQPAIGFSAPGAARFECRADSGDWAACESPWTTPSLDDGEHVVDVRALDDGEHVVDVRALDDAGQVGPSTSRWLTVDQTAPDTVIDSGPAARSPGRRPRP